LFLQRHIQLNYPVDELVLAVHRDTGPSDIMSNAAPEHRHGQRARLPKMLRSAVFLVVHRYDNSVYYRRIDRENFRLLSALQKGALLGDALESAFRASHLTPEEQAARIQGYFAHESELGRFCRQHSS
jgi:hypothetical protein